MPLHLVKMCVGCDSIEDLRQWQAVRLNRGEALRHQTRNMPKRADEVLYGGSLYWIIKGQIRVRQRIVSLTGGMDGEGRKFCAIGLAPELVETILAPHRPMQGWRYMTDEDAPADRAATGLAESDEMPAHMVDELKALGLI